MKCQIPIILQYICKVHIGIGSRIGIGSVSVNTPFLSLRMLQTILTLSYVDSMIPDSDMALYASLDNEDPSEESFEQLFEKMRLMKGKEYFCCKTCC